LDPHRPTRRTAVVVGQAAFPPPITDDYDPCVLVEDGSVLSVAC